MTSRKLGAIDLTGKASIKRGLIRKTAEKRNALIGGRPYLRVPSIMFDFKKDGKWLEDLALVSQLGLTMAGSILFCFVIGYYLDKWLNTKGLFIGIFILLGIAGGGYTVYKQIMKVTEKGKDDK